MKKQAAQPMTIKTSCEQTALFEGTGFEFALSLISGKYKMYIIYLIAKNKVMRYTEIKRSIEKIAHKSLSNALKALEEDGLVIRNEYPQIPPKVEYSLSENGKAFIPILASMCQWGDEVRSQCFVSERDK